MTGFCGPCHHRASFHYFDPANDPVRGCADVVVVGDFDAVESCPCKGFQPESRLLRIWRDHYYAFRRRFWA